MDELERGNSFLFKTAAHSHSHSPPGPYQRGRPQPSTGSGSGPNFSFSSTSRGGSDDDLTVEDIEAGQDGECISDEMSSLILRRKKKYN